MATVGEPHRGVGLFRGVFIEKTIHGLQKTRQIIERTCVLAGAGSCNLARAQRPPAAFKLRWRHDKTEDARRDGRSSAHETDPRSPSTLEQGRAGAQGSMADLHQAGSGLDSPQK